MMQITKRQALKIAIVLAFILFLFSVWTLFTRIFFEEPGAVWFSNINFQRVTETGELPGTDLKIVAEKCPNPVRDCNYLASKTSGKTYLGTWRILPAEVNGFATIELKGSKYLILENSSDTGFQYQVYKLENEDVLSARFISESEMIELSPVDTMTLYTRNRISANSSGLLIYTDRLGVNTMISSILYSFIPANADIELLD